MYNPPTKNSRRDVPYLALVNQADPDLQQAKHREVEYAFSRRVFTGDPFRRGAYNNFSNIYPVGRPHGDPE